MPPSPNALSRPPDGGEHRVARRDAIDSDDHPNVVAHIKATDTSAEIYFPNERIFTRSNSRRGGARETALHMCAGCETLRA